MLNHQTIYVDVNSYSSVNFNEKLDVVDDE